MHIVSKEDILQKMSKPMFGKKIEKYFKMSYAEKITQSAKR